MPLTERVDVVGLAQAAAEAGLAQVGEYILAESRRLVPIEEATLARSGAVAVDGLTVQVSYDTPYAVRQHEDLSLRHDAGRTAKYLERPVRASGPAVQQILGAEMRRRAT